MDELSEAMLENKGGKARNTFVMIRVTASEHDPEFLSHAAMRAQLFPVNFMARHALLCVLDLSMSQRATAPATWHIGPP